MEEVGEKMYQMSKGRRRTMVVARRKLPTGQRWSSVVAAAMGSGQSERVTKDGERQEICEYGGERFELAVLMWRGLLCNFNKI